MSCNARRRSREITLIRDVAQHVSETVNLIGIVVEFSLPRKSCGSDFVSILRIVDGSQQSQELSVNIFTEKLEHLPVLKSHGDLILLHNVYIEKHDSDAEANAVFNKKVSSFGLFNGNNSDNCSCYQAFTKFSISSQEENYLRHLRNWWNSNHIDLGKSEYLKSVRDIVIDDCFDLVCKVLHINYDDYRGRWILYVWDGMDVPSLSIDGNCWDEKNHPLPLQVESKALDQNILFNFEPIGTVLRVIAHENHKNLGTQFQGVGKWMRIRKMSGEMFEGMWYGALDTHSRVRLLPDNDSIVVDCKRKFEERKLEYGKLPSSSFVSVLTVIESNETESIQFITLMDALICEKDDIFCCVRVVAISPFPDEEFCSSNKVLESVFRLTLEDATARIHAFLLKDELVNFLNGYPEGVLASKMKALLGIPVHQNVNDNYYTRFPPFVKLGMARIRNEDSGDMIYNIRRTRLA